MPKIIEAKGFAVIIRTADHIPSHVHVLKNGNQVKIQLKGENGQPLVVSSKGDISEKEIRFSLELVTKHQQKLLESWRKIHGSD